MQHPGQAQGPSTPLWSTLGTSCEPPTPAWWLVPPPKPGLGLVVTSLVLLIFTSISGKTLPIYLKDSITTWEVLAVSLSPTKGM